MTTSVPTQRDPRRPEAPDWGVDYGISELWSEITPGLYVGGTDDHDTIAYQTNYEIQRRTGDRYPTDVEQVLIQPEDFDAVVTLYAFARPVGWGVQELRSGFMDGAQVPAQRDLLELVEWAHRRWTRGERVLVRCQAGLNRSGLIAALVLVRAGLEPMDAVSLLRERRSSHSLFNKTFLEYVLGVDGADWRE
jgi:hypothetical protein